MTQETDTVMEHEVEGVGVAIPSDLPIAERPWRDPDVWPPTDLPDGDGDKLESPWHFKNIILIMLSYLALHGGSTRNSYVGGNMFVYYSIKQARNRDYRGPDVFIVKDVDGTRERRYWAIWEEDGRYPDVIFELLSDSTEQVDLNDKKKLYAETFRTREYYCVAHNVRRVYGWRLNSGREYEAIDPDERGWLWSKELGVWLGGWRGSFMSDQYTWLRFYDADGELVLVGEEAARQRAAAAEQDAEEERQRAEEERQRAEEERQRAEEEQQRAAAAEQEAETERQRVRELEAQLAAAMARLKQEEE